MKLHQLFSGLADVHLPTGDLEISGLSQDSRQVVSGEMYIAVKGSKFDGNRFVPDVIKRGIKVILSEDPRPPNLEQDICWITVPNVPSLISKLSRRFYGNPSDEIRMIGVTGTNGKTTTTYLIESILTAAQKGCGVVGTVNYRMGQKVFPSNNTTPGVIENQRLLRLLADEGAEYCVMEVSSHALDQGRVNLINYSVGIFTNLTGDHLDYHGSLENYFNAKSKLFQMLSPEATAVINIDDPYGRKLVSRTKARVISYSIKSKADVMAQDIEVAIEGTRFRLVTPDGGIMIQTPLVGEYNVANILGAAAACYSEGISLEKIKKGIESLGNVPGRLERVDCGQNFAVFIDYAHTHDALENVLKMFRQTGDRKMILVFGCGGDRDKTKRPKMGKVADELADFTIVTSDNPRSEVPEKIIDEIITGFKSNNYTRITNRQDAIVKALEMAQPNDVVLIAGKGHETYQVFKDTTINFDEKSIVRSLLLC